MIFIKAHSKQFIVAGSLAAVVAFTVTACGGGNVAAPDRGSATGQWTKADVSTFTAAAGGDGSTSQDACIIGYFERDMSFDNAMAVASVDPASSSMSTSQIKAALISKYGLAKGDAISAQFGQVATDSASNCSGPAASATAPAASAPAAAPEPTADPAATSESSCSIDCVNPVPSGESGWLAQVQGALQNVQQDLTSLSSDASSDPGNVAVDGSQLTTDAQAALDPNYDPPPADNADWVTAMNDYVTAGEDYSGQNVNQQDDNPAQANQELGEANAALAKFNAANGGVLNGTIQSLFKATRPI
jgi:polyisoprenoid-binding protein YceI